MDKSAEYPVEVRRHSLRVLCMLMLVLMHLDIYGGSVMSLLDASPAPVACRQACPSSDAGQEEAVGGAYEEWADPDYRRQVLRHSHLCRPGGSGLSPSGFAPFSFVPSCLLFADCSSRLAGGAFPARSFPSVAGHVFLYGFRCVPAPLPVDYLAVIPPLQVDGFLVK